MNVVTVEALLNWQVGLPFVLQIDLDDHETQYLPHVILLQCVPLVYPPHLPYVSRSYTK